MKSASGGSARTGIRTTSSSPAIDIAALVTSIILLLVFLSYRGQDIGKIPELLGHLGSSFTGRPKLGILLANFTAVATGLACFFSWYGAGSVVCRLIGLDGTSGWMRSVWSLAIGQVFWSLAWFLLGAVHLMQGSVALVLLLAGLIIFAVEARRTLSDVSAITNDGLTRFLAISTGVILLLCVISTLAPVTGKDAMVYRLVIPESFASAGGFTHPGQNIFGYLALGAEMNASWALLAARSISVNAGESAFAFTLFLSFPILLAAVFGIARRWSGSSRSAAVVTLTCAAVPTMYFVSASSYIDHVVALYILLTVHSVAEWIESRENSTVLAAGIALGMACSVKLTAGFVVPGLALGLLITARRLQKEGADVLKQVVMACGLIFGVAALVGAPWYLRTWKLTGSPVFPFYAHIWPGSAQGWDAERSQLSQIYLSQYGGSNKGLVDYLATPFRASLAAQPEIPADYDGVIGASFLLAVLLLALKAFRGRLSLQSGLFMTVALTWYFAWLMTSQQLRFLLPALPLLLIAAFADDKEKDTSSHWWQAAMLIGSLGGFLTISAWFVELNPIGAAIGSETRDHFLLRRLDYYSYYRIIQSDTSPQSRIWLVNMRNDTLNLGRSFVADYVFEDFTLTALVKKCDTLPQLQAEVDKLGVDYALIRHDVLFDYRRTPVVDERRPEPENRAKLQLLMDFFKKGRKVLKEDEKFLLVDLRRSTAVQ